MTETELEPILGRVMNGERPTPGERRALFEVRDLLALGMAADEVRRRRHGARVTFVRVAHLQAAAAAAGETRWSGSPGELRLDGTVDDLPLAVAAVRNAAAAAGTIPVTGFSLADLQAAAAAAGRPLRDALAELRDAGLASVAWAPIDQLPEPETALADAGAAGLPVARLSVERLRADDREAIVGRAAALAEAHPGVRVFAPLPRRLAAASPSTGYEDVHLVALARLLVPVEHIQVDWALYGPKLAQVALAFGADDVDDVSPLDRVEEGRRRAPLEEIRRNIQAASGEPVERDARFAPLPHGGAADTPAV